MQLTGFLQIDGATIVDNYLTALHSRNEQACRWQIDADCPDCYCEHHTCSDGNGLITDAPWFDARNPGSGEFMGLYGTLRLSQPTASTVVTGQGTQVVAPLKQITFEGAIIACTSRGAQFGHRWIQDILEPLCDPCEGRAAEIGLWCPGEVCDDTTPDVSMIVDTVDWSTVEGLDGCDPAPPLEATPDPEPFFDDGIRIVNDIVYIPGSFQTLENDLPSCYGMRVTFSFALRSTCVHLPAASACVMGPPAAGDPYPCCSPLMFDLAPDNETCGCPTSCECSATDPVTASSTVRAPDGVAECAYSTPLCSRTFACLTRPFPFDLATPVITIENDDPQPMHNVSVTIWEARPGLAHPSTAEGFQQYCSVEPVTPPALIPYLPPWSTLTIDGRTESDTVMCGGLRDAAAGVVACGGVRYQHPTLCCGSRYWVAVETECPDPGGWQVRVELHGIERV